MTLSSVVHAVDTCKLLNFSLTTQELGARIHSSPITHLHETVLTGVCLL